MAPRARGPLESYFNIAFPESGLHNGPISLLSCRKRNEPHATNATVPGETAMVKTMLGALHTGPRLEVDNGSLP